MNYKAFVLFSVIFAVLFAITGFRSDIIENTNLTSNQLASISSDSLVFNESNYTQYQFYPNMRFQNKNINYSFEDTCSPLQKESIYKSFRNLENLTVLRFNRTTENQQLRIYCNQISTIEEPDYDLRGQGLEDVNISFTNYSIITNGRLFLYGTLGGSNCSMDYIIETHELLHIFGFTHNLTSEESLMFPYFSSCENMSVDAYFIDIINKLYDEEI